MINNVLAFRAASESEDCPYKVLKTARDKRLVYITSTAPAFADPVVAGSVTFREDGLHLLCAR